MSSKMQIKEFHPVKVTPLVFDNVKRGLKVHELPWVAEANELAQSTVRDIRKARSYSAYKKMRAERLANRHKAEVARELARLGAQAYVQLEQEAQTKWLSIGVLIGIGIGLIIAAVVWSLI